MTVTVEAKNPVHAREIVERSYKDSEYVLDAEFSFLDGELKQIRA